MERLRIITNEENGAPPARRQKQEGEQTGSAVDSF